MMNLLTGVISVLNKQQWWTPHRRVYNTMVTEELPLLVQNNRTMFQHSWVWNCPFTMRMCRLSGSAPSCQHSWTSGSGSMNATPSGGHSCPDPGQDVAPTQEIHCGSVFVGASLVVQGGRGALCCPGCRCRPWAWPDSRPPSSGGENRAECGCPG